MANGGTRPAGWLQDPTGRNELRYWDGTAWTDNASTAGKALTDPVDGPSGSIATGGATTAMTYSTQTTTAPSATVSSAPFKVCPHCQAENRTAAKVCPRCGKRFHLRKRWPWVVSGIFILLVVTVVGFLMFVGAANSNASKTLDTEQALHAITQQQFDAVAPGTPRAGVISQLGKQPEDAREPAANEAPIDNNTAPCIYYGRTGGGFGDSYQFCFASGVLSSKAPY